MAGSENLVLLIGNLGADPEVRQTQDGKQIANLRLATTDSWQDKQSGERKDKVEWHTVVLFGGQATTAQQYLKKGSKVYIRGALRSRKWQDGQGNDRYITEIIGQQMTMLDASHQSEKRENTPQRPQNSGTPPRNFPGRQSHANATWGDDSKALDDDVPW